jgi:glycosyltransferase involved in cell wall biosynthesis
MSVAITKAPKSRRKFSDPRVALVHYWYFRRRGGERVFDVIADMFPSADVFMILCDRRALSPQLSGRHITTSELNHLPFVKRYYRSLLSLFPYALEQFDLFNYDLVISHEAGPAKGVLTRADAQHVCYCHTPPRYLWDMYHHYLATAPLGPVGRLIYQLSCHSVRNWDYLASTRVDHFVASSQNSARRIRKYYGRDSRVIYPPVNLDRFRLSNDPAADFYLVVSPLVSYKRVDLAIRACNELRRNLIIIGQGECEAGLRKLAGPTVKFLGFQPDHVVEEYYRSCRAFLFPGEEDIGLTPIEAQASGRPVIAYARGGALETVVGLYPNESASANHHTGVFFTEQSSDSLGAAMLAFESMQAEFAPSFIRSHARRFDEEYFKESFAALINSLQPNRLVAPRKSVPVPAD